MIRSAVLAASAGRPGLSFRPIRHVASKRTDLTAVAQATRLAISGGSNTGTSTVVATQPPGGQAGFLRLDNLGTNGSTWGITLASPMNLTAGYLRVLLRIVGSRATAVRSLTIAVATSAAEYAAGNYHRYSVRPSTTLSAGNANWLTDDTWTYEAVAPGISVVFGSGSSLTSVGYVAVSGSTISGQTFQLDVARLEQVAYAAPRAQCVFWHDDTQSVGAQGMDDKLAPYGWRWTEATIWETLDTGTTSMSAAQARTFAASGVSFGSHAASQAEHNQREPASLQNHVIRNRAAARDFGIVGAGTADLAWWGGQSIKQQYVDVAAQYYRSGRYNTSALTLPEMLPPANPFAYKALLTDSGNTFADLWKPYIDNAMSCRGLASFVFHNDLGTNATTKAEFDLLLAYLDNNRANIDVVTADTAMTYCL